MEWTWDYKIDKSLKLNNHIFKFLGFGLMLSAFSFIQFRSGLNNKIAVLLAVISAVLLVSGFICVYIKKFFKVQIGANGFYIQTTRKNGKYYEYTDIVDCSVDYKFHNRLTHSYSLCIFNFMTKDDKKHKFTFDFIIDYSKIDVLKDRIKSKRKRKGTITMSSSDDVYEYIIDGRKGSTGRLIFMTVLSVLFTALAVIQYTKYEKSVVVVMFTALAGFSILILFKLLYRFAFFKVKVGVNGFYLKTGVSEGEYFDYRHLVSAEIASASNHNKNSVPFYFFKFTDNSGLTRSFQIDINYYESEIKELKRRIDSDN